MRVGQFLLILCRMNESEGMNMWYVYIVQCSDDSLYTGITKDLTRRVEEHNSNDILGARYTRARRPVSLVYEEVLNTRAEAARREYELKLLRRKDKLALIKEGNQLIQSY